MSIVVEVTMKNTDAVHEAIREFIQSQVYQIRGADPSYNIDKFEEMNQSEFEEAFE